MNSLHSFETTEQRKQITQKFHKIWFEGGLGLHAYDTTELWASIY